MQDLFKKFTSSEGYFGQLRSMGDRYYTRPTLSPNPGTKMQFQGSPHIMWSVNNYLGLANHPEIQEVAAQALKDYGISSPMGSRMMSGTTELHIALEEQLAAFAQKEASYLFNYGYLGVMGTISALTGSKDTVVVDKLAHACIVDGAFLSGAKVRIFRHNNLTSLESILKQVQKHREGGVLIVTEGVYGMTGDLAPLDEIVALKEKYQCRLYVDDAHGCGVMGAQGRGTADHLGVQEGIDIYFGTFAKAFAAIGGFSASSKEAIEWIGYNARTQVFAKSLPMIYTVSMMKMLELIMTADERRAELWKRSNALKQALRNLGYTIGPGDSPICSVFLPAEKEAVETLAMKTIKYLRLKQVFVSAVIYPVIPPGLCMFRMIPTSDHSEEDIAHTVTAYAQMRDELGLRLTLNEHDKERLRQLYGTQSF